MLTFTNCVTLTARRSTRKLAGNTWLEVIDADTFGIRYHATTVVKIHRNGTYTLKTGGWQTVTTKGRINEYSPARVFQKSHAWFLATGVPFTENVVVGSNGLPVDAATVSRPAPLPVAAALPDLFTVG